MTKTYQFAWQGFSAWREKAPSFEQALSQALSRNMDHIPAGTTLLCGPTCKPVAVKE